MRYVAKAWDAVVYGMAYVAAFLMVAMMVVVGSRKLMGQFTAGIGLAGLGWLSTAVMAGATVAMAWFSL